MRTAAPLNPSAKARQGADAASATADRRGSGNLEHVLDPSSLYEDKEVKLSDLETDLSHNR